MRLHNTLTRRVEDFVPADPARVTLYVCGPTVYNYIHIGNARTFTVFDLLARTLKRRFPNVVYARNITDIDDKINAAARELGVPIGAVTARFDAAFQDDMRALGLLAPDVVPYATAHIGAIIAMCERLIASGHAYAADGHVLFAVARFPEYGQLSRRDPDEMLAGARIDVAPYKRDPGDFVLWKPSDDSLPGWDSPWGRGRPGWHIECSAMAATHLGESIDLHGGGMDLQFPHHENEIAQSQCAHGGKVFARHWLHSGMLNLDGAKMSKSLGNTFRVHDLLAHYPAEALRYALLSGHYRQPLDWSQALIEQSIRTLDRLYGTLRDLADVTVDGGNAPIPAVIEAALDDDLDTPAVLAAIAEIAATARKAVDPAERAARKAALLGAGRALNVLQMDPAAWFARGIRTDDDEAARIQARIDERTAAKKARDFRRADAIRDELAAAGIVLEDTAQGVRWSRRRD
ncbi:MAG: cysteine--tRNA ligase [Proteobacteria bacterium]|nr:cysteine--tRNA ligase [Pseudomonadota bacterium]